MHHSAASAKPDPILALGRALGLEAADLDVRGPRAAKVRLGLLEREPARARARYVLVTAVSSVAAERGAGMHAIGLSMALNRLGSRSVCTIRETVAPGSGSCTVGPPDVLAAIGDRDDVARACALLREVALSHDVLAPQIDDDVAASEPMAIVALAVDRRDLLARLGRVVVGEASSGGLLTVDDLSVRDPLAAILRQTLRPNLVATADGSPALVHTSASSDGALGCPSLAADLVALRCADFVVTEAGDGAAVGAERFCNVKCRISGLRPDVAVLACTLRALRQDGGAAMERQLGVLRLHGLPVVVAIEREPGDTDADVAGFERAASAAGAFAVAVGSLFEDGARGGAALARGVQAAAGEPPSFRFLYPSSAPLADKIAVVASRVHGARTVGFSVRAQEELAALERCCHGGWPVCVDPPPASSDPAVGQLTIDRVRLRAGAGFVAASARRAP